MRGEIFDIIKPKEQDSFTLAELSASDLSEHVCGMLIDGQCLFDYDQREYYMQQQQQQEDE